MPYITKDRRLLIDPTEYKRADNANTAGELNFQFTRLVLEYLETNGRSYQKINDILGALEGCKLEFYRRMAAPYEDGKIITNGDVYDV